MKRFLFILSGFLCQFAKGQDSLGFMKTVISSSQPATVVTPEISRYKPEILTSGFIDILNNGQLNASARFIRLYIGEPKKIQIPLSFYSGVSSNSFQPSAGQKPNELLGNNFINPLSGLANGSVDGILFFSKKRSYTRCGILYHIGERILTGVSARNNATPLTVKPVNFLNTFATGGFYFQTGAWDRNNSKNMGISWIALRYIICHTDPKDLKEMFPSIMTNGLYHGYSLAWGGDISGFVNIKLVYYKYVKAPEVNYSSPVYQFSFNYSMKN